jgi:hypothetical protein
MKCNAIPDLIRDLYPNAARGPGSSPGLRQEYWT